MLWEGENPEIPLGPARERRAKASAGRLGAQALRHSGVQDWAQPTITEAREAKINPAAPMAKNQVGRSRFSPGCLVICQQVRERIAIRTFICRKALQELDSTQIIHHQLVAVVKKLQQGLDLQLKFWASRDGQENWWVGKGFRSVW